jgi:hypothetical protein
MGLNENPEIVLSLKLDSRLVLHKVGGSRNTQNLLSICNCLIWNKEGDAVIFGVSRFNKLEVVEVGIFLFDLKQRGIWWWWNVIFLFSGMVEE